MREEYRLCVSVNKVLRRISGSKRDETTEQWRKLQNERSFVICTPHKIQYCFSN
jgi:hypothetical protein